MARTVTIVGGGAAGMTAAGQLARSGIEVVLVEKESVTGGHVKEWHHLFPDRRDSNEVVRFLESQVNHKSIIIIRGDQAEAIEKKGKKFILTTASGKEITSDAILLATGFDLFRSSRKEEYGYGIYENVITSADLEVMFRNGGPVMKNGNKPGKAGIIHCVGSRDEKAGNLYCSKLCCITAVKQAMEIKDSLNDARVFCFYMDMRMGGAMYEEIYRDAQENYGISFIRGKVSEVSENFNNKLVVKVEDTLLGRPLKMELDMLILMAGMEMAEGGKKLAASAGLKTGQNRFFAPADNHFGNNLSNIRGIFYAGTCTAPMNITETISHSRSAVLEIVEYLRNER